jgi:hypothetical protein
MGCNATDIARQTAVGWIVAVKWQLSIVTDGAVPAACFNSDPSPKKRVSTRLDADNQA